MGTPRLPFDRGSSSLGSDFNELEARLRRLADEVKQRREPLREGGLHHEARSDRDLGELQGDLSALKQDFKDRLRCKYRKLFDEDVDNLLNDRARLLWFLDCGDRVLRAGALGVIVHFSKDLPNYKDKLLEMVDRSDSDSIKRSIILSLGIMHMHHNDNSVFSVLKRIILDEAMSISIRMTAYIASLSNRYILYNKLTCKTQFLSFPDDVDWEYVRSLPDY